MDRVEFVQLTGGLNEEAGEISASPGSIRKSINYQALPTGGYEQIYGSRRFSGGNVTPKREALLLLELDTVFRLGDFVENLEIRAVGQQSGSDSIVLVAEPRPDDNTTLLLVERLIPTEEMFDGEDLVISIIGQRKILQIDPDITEQERFSLSSQLAEFATDVAVQPAGDGEIKLLYGYKNSLFAIRENGADELIVQRTLSTNSRVGQWVTLGTMTKDPAPNGNSDGYSAVGVFFDGRQDAVYFTTGHTQAFYWNFGTVGLIEIDGHGVTTPRPSHVIDHQNHLFLAFDASLIHSDIGAPTEFSGVGGAAEINVGDEITGLEQLAGTAMAVYSTDRISILEGTSTADWVLSVHSDETGAVRGTNQGLPTAIFFDRRGVSTLSSVDAFGGFRTRTLTHEAQRTVERITHNTELFSTINRELSQYRLINSQGRGIYMTFSANSLVGIMEVDLRHKITAMGQQSETGETYFASDDGWVHVMDYGGTFSGQDIGAFLEFPPQHYGSPHRRKRFKRIVLEMRGDERVEMEIENHVERGEEPHCVPAEVDIESLPSVRTSYRNQLIDWLDTRFRAVAYLVGIGFDHRITLRPKDGRHGHRIDSMSITYTMRGRDK